MSVILDASQYTAKPDSDVAFTIAVKNAGPQDSPARTVMLTLNDMRYIGSSVFCFVQTTDTTYLRCTTPPIAKNSTLIIKVVLHVPASFTCIDSTGGRSTFAFIRNKAEVLDLYPQNDTSNTVNTLPYCGY